MRRTRSRSTGELATTIGVATLAVAAVVAAGVMAIDSAGHAADETSRQGAHYDASLFTPERYAREAAALPSALSSAVRTQLHLTAAAYLADTAAAARAELVVESLGVDGVDVLGSHMAGTALTVYVRGGADASRARAAGATPIVGAPPKVAIPAVARAVSAPASVGAAPADAGPVGPTTGGTLEGGDGYYFTGKDPTGAGGSWVCSVGFNGNDPRTGASEFLTAGHCGSPAAYIDTPDGPVTGFTESSVGSIWLENDTLGSFLKSTFRFGGGDDAGLVKITNRNAQTAAMTTSWGGGQANAGIGVPVIGQSAGIVGAYVCRSGSSSGWQCGVISAVDRSEQYATGQLNRAGTGSVMQTINTIVTTACSVPGDSGGPVMMGEYAVGITSLSDWGNCSATTIARNNARLAAGYTDDSNPLSRYPVNYTYVFPMISAAHKHSVAAQFGGSWKLDVTTASAVSGLALRSSKPSISGSPTVGSTLTARPGSWTVGTDLSYRWYAGAHAIPGANRPTLVVPPVAKGVPITLRITGTRTGYRSSMTVSSATKRVSPGRLRAAAPRIVGTPRPGARLTVKPGSWTPNARFSYRWFANGHTIRGATSATLTVPPSLRGARLTAEVTARKPGFLPASKVTPSALRVS